MGSKCCTGEAQKKTTTQCFILQFVLYEVIFFIVKSDIFFHVLIKQRFHNGALRHRSWSDAETQLLRRLLTIQMSIACNSTGIELKRTLRNALK